MFLVGIVLVQWIIIVSLIMRTQQSNHELNPIHAATINTLRAAQFQHLDAAQATKMNNSMKDGSGSEDSPRQHPLPPAVSSFNGHDSSNIGSIQQPGMIKGVAVTLFLRNPKWFHRRYVIMLNNAMNNLPDGWALQVFVNQGWLEKDVLRFHPALRRMLGPAMQHQSANQTITTSRIPIIVTPLPQNMTARRTKPKEVLKSRWFWNSVAAENVFVFGGNGAVCSNHRSESYDWDVYTQYDFVGVPNRGRYNGVGGDGGTHSFRHRSAMLSIIDEFPPEKSDDVDWKYFLQHMYQKNQAGAQERLYRLATPEVTRAFGGIQYVTSDQLGTSEKPDLVELPLVLSGTLASLNWTIRDHVLNICPELKAIFPSLHEPSCFGAHPNGEQCKATICALRDKLPSGGC